MVWIQYWAWLEQEVGPDTSCSPFQPNLLWYAELCPQESPPDSWGWGQPCVCCSTRERRTEQCAIIPLYSLSICSSFSDLGGNAKGKELQQVWPPLPACGEPQPGHCKLKRQSRSIHPAFSCSTPGIVPGESWMLNFCTQNPNICSEILFGAPRRSQSHLRVNFRFTLLANTMSSPWADEPCDEHPWSQLKSTIAQGR